MSLPHISPAEAKRLLDDGAILVDVREPDEHNRERIPGAKSVPLSRMPDHKFSGISGDVMIFHCKTGNRTKSNASSLANRTDSKAFVLDGGIDAWKLAGLPVHREVRQPIEIMRQVQITAGSLALAGTLLGFLVHSGFYVLSGFIGAGLMFSGVTGTCAMAHILKLMPWNQVRTQ